MDGAVPDDVDESDERIVIPSDHPTEAVVSDDPTPGPLLVGENPGSEGLSMQRIHLGVGERPAPEVFRHVFTEACGSTPFPPAAESVVQRTVDEYGGMDILLNNAGVMLLGPILDAVRYIVTRPRHVAINEILIRPTEQQP